MRALYRGFTPTMVGMIPYAGFSFYCFESMKYLCMKYLPTTLCRKCDRNTGESLLNQYHPNINFKYCFDWDTLFIYFIKAVVYISIYFNFKNRTINIQYNWSVQSRWPCIYTRLAGSGDVILNCPSRWHSMLVRIAPDLIRISIRATSCMCVIIPANPTHSSLI